MDNRNQTFPPTDHSPAPSLSDAPSGTHMHPAACIRDRLCRSYPSTNSFDLGDFNCCTPRGYLRLVCRVGHLQSLSTLRSRCRRTRNSRRRRSVGLKTNHAPNARFGQYDRNVVAVFDPRHWRSNSCDFTPAMPGNYRRRSPFVPVTTKSQKRELLYPSVGKLIPLTPLPLLHLSVRTQST